jgi:protein-S-isoprenylcysteine O-methyltransferase Ste14
MPGNPLTDENWAPELADQITDFIGNIRDKTTNNAIKLARGLVFGLLALLLGVVALALLLIGATRGLQALIDLGTSWERAVYVSYFVVGGILTLAGLFLMGKRTSADS